MTVSVNTNFELNRDNLIRRACQLAGLLEASQFLNGDDVTLAADLLNIEILSLQAQGVVVTQIERATIPLVAATAEVTLHPTTLDVIGDPNNVAGMVYTVAGGTETPVVLITRAEYQAIPNKALTGTPSLVFIERATALVKAVFWPVPAVAMTFRHSRSRLPKDMDTGAVTLDLARRWQKAIVMSLAYNLALAKSAPLARVKFLFDEAERQKAIALTADVEKGHIQMVVY